MNCVICGNLLDPSLVSNGQTTHPTCLFAELDDQENPVAQELKNSIIEVIKWADRQNPRAQQVLLGPSEIGTPCERRLGYRLAELPAVNTDVDPWAAIIGTAMHGWLEGAFTAYCGTEAGQCDWITEQSIPLTPLVTGRSDLYSRKRKMVIDHKGVGNDVMRKIRKNGPPPGYVVQVQLYGLGYERQGYPVKTVALVFYPRAGRLKDVYVWATDYDPSVGQAALDRIFDVAMRLNKMDIINNPHRWQQVPAYVSDECGFCPMYDPGRELERGATETGCPGRI